MVPLLMNLITSLLLRQWKFWTEFISTPLNILNWVSITKTYNLRPVHKYAIKHSELSFDYED